jgi:hypothetical protein
VPHQNSGGHYYLFFGLLTCRPKSFTAAHHCHSRAIKIGAFPNPKITVSGSKKIGLIHALHGKILIKNGHGERESANQLAYLTISCNIEWN